MHKAMISKCEKFIKECNATNTTTIKYEDLLKSINANKDLSISNVAEGHAIQYLKERGISIIDKNGNIITVSSKQKSKDTNKDNITIKASSNKINIIDITNINDTTLYDFIIDIDEHRIVAIYDSSTHIDADYYFNHFKTHNILFKSKTVYVVPVSIVIKCMKAYLDDRYLECFNNEDDMDIINMYYNGYLYLFDMNMSDYKEIPFYNYHYCIKQFDNVHWLYYLVEDFYNIH